MRHLRPRTFLARQSARLAEHWTGRTLLAVDHPPRRIEPRYGHGRPPHAALFALLATHHDAYARNLETAATYADDLAAIPRGPDPSGLAWLNQWFPPLDVAVLYAFLRARDPARFVEVGSGVSTLCARRAADDGGLRTEITSIDPEPRADVDASCHRVVRQPLELADPAVFDGVEAGDVVFLDGSHHVLTNSDTVAFFLDVLPSLPDGVLVGVHDVLWPDDYPPEWSQWHWSEQYLVAAILLARGDQIRLELATHYAQAHAGLDRILDPLWQRPEMQGVPRTGVALWMTTTGRDGTRGAG